MTKILNFALKIKGVVGRVAHAKSSDPATPPPKKKFGTCTLPIVSRSVSPRGRTFACPAQQTTSLRIL